MMQALRRSSFPYTDCDLDLKSALEDGPRDMSLTTFFNRVRARFNKSRHVLWEVCRVGSNYCEVGRRDYDAILSPKLEVT
jgi:hypothetical protein